MTRSPHRLSRVAWRVPKPALCGLLVPMSLVWFCAPGCGLTSRNAGGGTTFGEVPDASVDASTDAAPDASGPDAADAEPSLPGHPPSGSRCDLSELYCGQTEAPEAAYRLLSLEEYNNAVFDLLGASPQEGTFPYARHSDTRGLNDAEQEPVRSLAETVAGEVASSAPSLLDCAGDEAELDCVRRFIVEKGRLFYSRPVDDAEQERLVAVYEEAGADDVATGFEALLVALLSSERFLFRSEMGRTVVTSESVPDGDVELETKIPTGVVALDGYELASRLSYWLWLSAPDDTLLDLADSGELTRPAVLREQAERLLNDPRALRSIDPFNEDWLLLGRLSSRAEDGRLDPELAEAMREESVLLGRDLYLEERSFAALFEATHTFANEALREVYGDELEPGSATDPDEFTRAELSEARPGLLTRAGWLTATSPTELSSPAGRAVNLLSGLVCLELGAPPAGPEHTSGLDRPEDLTAREYLESEIGNRPECFTCHQYLDGAGLSFEHFDGLGRYRETDNGREIDTSGSMLASMDVRLDFEDAADLLHQIANLPEAYECFTRGWLERAVGYDLHMPCSLRQATRTTCETGDLVALIAELATTEVFRFVKYRDDSDYEVISCDREGSTNCEYLDQHTDVPLEECETHQGALCDPQAETDSVFPCLGVTVIRGCCSDDECHRAGLSLFCGRGLSPHGVCVTSDPL